MLEQLPREAVDAPSIHGGVEGQVGWGRGQPGLVLSVEVGGPVCGGGWSCVILGVPSNLCYSVKPVSSQCQLKMNVPTQRAVILSQTKHCMKPEQALMNLVLPL